MNSNQLKQNFGQCFVILLILLTAFFLRTYQLDQQALRGDEAATVLYSAMPINELWELSRVTDPHPPLYYAMLHPWQWLAGEDGWAMRFAGAVAGTLAVAVLYALAQQTLQITTISLLAATLLAINPLQIWLAQDVRSYPFFTLFGLLSSLTLWGALNDRLTPNKGNTSPQTDKPGPIHYDFVYKVHNFVYKAHNFVYKAHNFVYKALRFTPWLLYILFSSTCLYIHYYTVFLITFQGLFVLINAKIFWSKKWPWLVSQITIMGLIIPGLQLAYNFMGQAAGGIDTIPLYEILRLTSTALLTGFTIADSWGLGLTLLLAPIWLFGIISLLRNNFATGTFWTLFFVTPVFGVIALSLDRPFFKERFLIQAQPAFELLLVSGFFSLWQFSKKHTHNNKMHFALRFTCVGLLLFLLGTNFLALANYFTNPAYAKAPPWNLYHNYVKQKSEPGDVVLTNFPEASVSYYSPNHLPFYVVPAERDRSVEYRLEQTKKIAQAYQRIWFLPLLNQGFDEQGDVLNWLDRHADRVNQVFFPAYNINLYLSPTTIETLMIKQTTSFAHGIDLQGYQILDEAGKSKLETVADNSSPYVQLKAEDEFTLSLYWQGAGPTDIPYTIFTHFIAADGFNLVGQDNQPVWGSYPTTAWSSNEKVTDKYTLTVPPGTGPGDYRIRLGWYRPDTLERVPILDNGEQTNNDHVLLNLIIRVE